MEQEALRELNEIREYLEISKNEFKILLLMALKYKMENGQYIHEEDLYQIVEEAMNNMDYQSKDSDDLFVAGKTIEEAFNRALVNLGYKKVKRN